MSKEIELNADIKTNIGEVAKDAGDLASEFKVMGVSLNDIKKGFITVGATAKKSFATIKAGLISTGIGALVVAIGSLVTYFTQTEKGAEKLKVVFAGLGAAVSVIVDRIADFGGAILKFFKGDFSGAAQEMKAAFTGIGAEIKEDTELMMALQRATNALRDSERDLGVETAQRRAEIEELKMIAEDVTKTEKERLDAAKQAFKIEQDLLDKRVENAEKAVEIAQMQVDASHSQEEDLDNLAQLEINLANIRAESATKQIELNNKINAIEAETDRKRQENHDKQMARLKDEEDARNDMLTGQGTRMERQAFLREKFETENTLMAISNAAEREKKKLEIEREAQVNSIAYKTNTTAVKAAMDINYQMKSDALDRAIEQSKKDLANAELQAFGQLASALSTLAGDNKELAAASAIIDTYVGANKAFAQGGTLGFVSSAAIILQGLANVKRIYQTDVGTGTGGSTPSDDTPTRQFVSGSFDINAQGGIAEPDPIQAYVVTDDMTNSQNKLAQIRRRATI